MKIIPLKPGDFTNEYACFLYKKITPREIIIPGIRALQNVIVKISACMSLISILSGTIAKTPIVVRIKPFDWLLNFNSDIKKSFN